MPLAHPSDGRFSYADYLTWPEGERWELIDGETWDMTPAPTTVHQRLVGRLYHALETVLEGHPCVPFVAPVDVVLSDETVVQPDVLVVCDRSRIRTAGIFGAPDLIVEVLSPSTGLKDRRTKRHLYERHGVREYLLVEPEARYAERLTPGARRDLRQGRVLWTRRGGLAHEPRQPGAAAGPGVRASASGPRDTGDRLTSSLRG
jgi:Uma2 family endonuclease